MNNKLTERLQLLADLVLPGKPAADIGTDHGYLGLYLLESGKCPYAVLSDVNEGPLAKAKQNMEESSVDESLYSIRLGGGLATLQPGEAASIVIAGMGGELIASILEEFPEKTASAELLILQPRTRSGELRSWLWSNGYAIKGEYLVRERGRICEVITAARGKQAPGDPDIPETDSPLLAEFLDGRIGSIKRIIEGLEKSGRDSAALKERLKAHEERRLRCGD